MGENTITKPLGLVLIVTAHMVFNDPSHAEVVGILGNNITLQFIFNVSITENSHIAVYTTGEKKIDEYLKKKDSFDIYPQNSSVSYHITNLTLNHSNIYWASLFEGSGIPIKSNEVQLTTHEKNISSTAPPTSTQTTGLQINENYSFFSISNIVIVLVVLPVVLLATVLPWLVCSLVKPKDKQQQQQSPHQSSAPTVQETVESSSNMSAPSVVYSVLDFPKRPPTVVGINPRDTEYAAVGYLPEKRHM